MAVSIDTSDLADLLAQRNALDARIGAIIGRPALAGHMGEWIASKVFDIQLEDSAVAKAIDGRFRSGPLAGKSVNIKIHSKREGLLEFRSHAGLLPCAMRAESNDPDIQGRHSTVTRH